MTTRLLEAVRIVPPALWRHMGEQRCARPGIAAINVSTSAQAVRALGSGLRGTRLSLAIGGRGGVHWCGYCVVICRTRDLQQPLQIALRWLYEHRLIVLRDRDLWTMTIKANRGNEANWPIPSSKALTRRC